MQATGWVALLLTLVVGATLVAGCMTQDAGVSASCTLDERPMPVRAIGDPVTNDTVVLEITRDRGTVPLKRVNATVQAGDSVLDVLMRHAEVETAYGGGFVEAIDGLESGYPDDQVDWFFEVDGRVALVGAAEVDVTAGDHIHWDHRAWGATLPPGHFNSFPWHEAAATAWSGSWPDAPAVVKATRGQAPWNEVTWAEAADATVTACGKSFDAPWALIARADPAGSQRVLLVGDAFGDDRPATGHAWIHHDETTYEVELA